MRREGSRLASGAHVMDFWCEARTDVRWEGRREGRGEDERVGGAALGRESRERATAEVWRNPGHTSGRGPRDPLRSQSCKVRDTASRGSSTIGKKMMSFLSRS